MLRNFFTVAWRNLVKSIWYSLINIVGLSIGMAVALLIGLWIWDELSFDHYHTQHSRVAQILTTQTFNGQTGTGDATSMPVGRTPMSWWAFAAASLGALVITLLTVSYQAIRAALMNPVKSLRTE